jgi:hypothetical protein
MPSAGTGGSEVVSHLKALIRSTSVTSLALGQPQLPSISAVPGVGVGEKNQCESRITIPIPRITIGEIRCAHR